MTVPITGNLTELNASLPPLWMGSHGQAARAGRQLGYPPVKSRWSGIRRGGDLSSEMAPPRMPSNFHISQEPLDDREKNV